MEARAAPLRTAHRPKVTISANADKSRAHRYCTVRHNQCNKVIIIKDPPHLKRVQYTVGLPCKLISVIDQKLIQLIFHKEV